MDPVGDSIDVDAIKNEILQFLESERIPVTEAFIVDAPEGSACFILNPENPDNLSLVRGLVVCFEPRHAFLESHESGDSVMFHLVGASWTRLFCPGGEDDVDEGSSPAEMSEQEISLPEIDQFYATIASEMLEQDLPAQHAQVGDVLVGIMREAQQRDEETVARIPGWIHPRETASRHHQALRIRHRRNMRDNAEALAVEIRDLVDVGSHTSRSALQQIVLDEMKQRDPGCATNASVEPIVQVLYGLLHSRQKPVI